MKFLIFVFLRTSFIEIFIMNESIVCMLLFLSVKLILTKLNSSKYLSHFCLILLFPWKLSFIHLHWSNKNVQISPFNSTIFHSQCQRFVRTSWYVSWNWIINKNGMKFWMAFLMWIQGNRNHPKAHRCLKRRSPNFWSQGPVRSFIWMILVYIQYFFF